MPIIVEGRNTSIRRVSLGDHRFFSSPRQKRTRTIEGERRSGFNTVLQNFVLRPCFLSLSLFLRHVEHFATVFRSFNAKEWLARSRAELFAYTVRLGTVTSAFVHPNLARERVVSLPRGARRSGKATTGAESFG